MLPVLLHLGPIKIYSMGVMLLLGIFLSLYWWWKMGREEHLEEIELFDSYFLSLIAFGIGGRMVHVLSNWSELGTLYRALAILAFPGISVSGGVVTAALVLWLLTREKEWEWGRVVDMAVVAGSGLLMFGSIGALLNGSGSNRWVEGWGIVISVITFALTSRVRKDFRFYAWYKGQASVAKDGLAAWIWVGMMGISYLGVAGLTELGKISWQDLATGLVLLAVMGIGIYHNIGRKQHWWVNLLQWVRLKVRR